MRTSTQIDKRTTSVNGGAGAIGDLVRDNVLLVLVVGKHLEQLLLGESQTLEWLLFLDSLFSHLLQGLVVAGLDGTSIGNSHLVVETILNRRANAERAAVVSLTCLTENVSARVPEDLLALRVVKVEKFQLAGLFKRAIQIPEFAINTRDDGTFPERLADIAGDLVRGDFPRLANTHLTRGHGDVDILTGLLGDPCILLGLYSVEDGVAIGNVLRRWCHLKRSATLGDISAFLLVLLLLCLLLLWLCIFIANSQILDTVNCLFNSLLYSVGHSGLEIVVCGG